MSVFQLKIIEKLLIRLCRLEHSEQERQEIGDLMQQVSDWDEFVTRANAHGIIALCWYNITQTGNKKLIPERSLQQLYNGFLKSLARNSGIYNLLDEVLEIASSDNVQVILLKGLALEKTIYGNKGLRQMNDLDILVKREDAVKLRNLLLAKGFESMPMISPLHEKILPYYGKHLPEMYRKGLSVEIHFRMFDHKNEKLTKEIIETAIPGEKQGSYFPEEQFHLLYLIKHLDYHEKSGHSQLRLYADLVNMINQNKNIIPELIRKADSSGLKDIVAEKLFILEKFFSAEITPDSELSRTPDAVCRMPVTGCLVPDIQEDKVEQKFLAMLRTMQDDDCRTPDAGRRTPNILKPLGEFDSFRDKLFFIIGYLFPSIAFMKYRYKLKSTIPAIFWYPLRWIQGMSRLFR